MSSRPARPTSCAESPALAPPQQDPALFGLARASHLHKHLPLFLFVLCGTIWHQKHSADRLWQRVFLPPASFRALSPPSLLTGTGNHPLHREDGTGLRGVTGGPGRQLSRVREELLSNEPQLHHHKPQLHLASHIFTNVSPEVCAAVEDLFFPPGTGNHPLHREDGTGLRGVTGGPGRQLSRVREELLSNEPELCTHFGGCIRPMDRTVPCPSQRVTLPIHRSQQDAVDRTVDSTDFFRIDRKTDLIASKWSNRPDRQQWVQLIHSGAHGFQTGCPKKASPL
ncbi:hypothetical protein AAFF_G00363930 [Aldrovandia affinis]|uniref:Uncharacterized protein n=1 Tax=Aldrovandia affinis TaxID=143900 RepID=A0AAD7SHL0_9TELE|nr:hypothetical protein AAFF_G00363930 [Aldrovandia affinis]